jgi:hypothetical protein
MSENRKVATLKAERVCVAGRTAGSGPRRSARSRSLLREHAKRACRTAGAGLATAEPSTTPVGYDGRHAEQVLRVSGPLPDHALTAPVSDNLLAIGRVGPSAPDHAVHSPGSGRVEAAIPMALSAPLSGRGTVEIRISLANLPGRGGLDDGRRTVGRPPSSRSTT